MPAITNKNVVLPVEFSDFIFTGLRARSKALELGRRLPDMRGKTYKINVLDYAIKAGWVKNSQSPSNAEGAEINKKPVSYLAWKGIDLTAEEIAVIIPVAEDTLDDTQNYVDVVPQIYEDAIAAFQQCIDATVFFGVDSPWANYNGVVAGATTAGATVSWDGQDGTSFYKAVSDAMKYVETSGYLPTAILGGPSLNSAFRGTITNLGVVAGDQGQVGALPRHIDLTGGFDESTAFAVVGDFRQLVYAMRKEIELKILTEATIEEGDVKYNLAQQDMVGFRFKMRLAFALPNPVQRVSAQASGNAYKTGSTAYPFAVITQSGAGSN